MDALNAWRNATVLKPEHSLAWNNMIILLDNTGAKANEVSHHPVLWADVTHTGHSGHVNQCHLYRLTGHID